MALLSLAVVALVQVGKAVRVVPEVGEMRILAAAVVVLLLWAQPALELLRAQAAAALHRPSQEPL